MENANDPSGHDVAENGHRESTVELHSSSSSASAEFLLVEFIYVKPCVIEQNNGSWRGSCVKCSSLDGVLLCLRSIVRVAEFSIQALLKRNVARKKM